MVPQLHWGTTSNRYKKQSVLALFKDKHICD
jgi:hypothetical protein